jgi:hypothetical protein
MKSVTPFGLPILRSGLTSGDQAIEDGTYATPARSGQPAASCRAPCEDLHNMGGSGSGPECSLFRKDQAFSRTNSDKHMRSAHCVTWT